MGASQSAEAPPPSLEKLSHVLAQRFAAKCFTPLELYCFNSVFRSLADTQSGIRFWGETTLCRFLELPDALAVGSVIFQMASYLGAFPFPSHAPAILTDEALLKVVTIFTERYGAVLKSKGRRMWLRELYRSLAVYDRVNSPVAQNATSKSFGGLDKSKKSDSIANRSTVSTSQQGFAIDFAVEGDEDDDDDDDELVLAALDAMDVVDIFKQGEKSNVHHSMIPSDNFLKLIELLLLIAPIEPQESISAFAPQISEERVAGLRSTANTILLSFGIEKYPGITFKNFNAVINSTLPYLFNGLNPLFEYFLFAKELDLSKRKYSKTTPKKSLPPPTATQDDIPAPEPILRPGGEILNLDVLSQLSFFIKGTELFRRLRPLYSGNKAGFSMGSFEKSVFKWRAPSILLVSGTLLPPEGSNPRERALVESISHNRLPSSRTFHSNLPESTTFTFGAYIPVPWKLSHKSCFGDSQTVLFQLAPVHDVFKASSVSTDYVYFNRQPTHPTGVGLGTAVPTQSQAHSSRSSGQIQLGPVSLHLDDGLEYGIFTHLASGGGSFTTSQLPCRKGRDWQDRFEIESVEVWGCGGDKEAESQRKEWAWEEREAEMRRRVNLGTGDMEADKDLLRLAGIIGERSGGSV